MLKLINYYFNLNKIHNNIKNNNNKGKKIRDKKKLLTAFK